MYPPLQSLYDLIKLLRTQWQSPSEIEQIQRRKLKALLEHAYENVDYYRQLFDSAGIKPDEIEGREDLPRIPITTKRGLQSLPLQKITVRRLNLDRCTMLKTSGSTGIPLTIALSKEDLRARGALLTRTFMAQGCRLRDRRTQITNNPPRLKKNWYEYLGIRNRYGIYAFNAIDDQIDQLKKTSPDILLGNPSGLEAIAKRIKEKGVIGISPRIVLSGGEVLFPQTREFLDTIFKTTTYDLYNSFEFGSIAWECRYRNGYHISAESLIVEVLRDGRQALTGEPGEIVITALDLYAMPLIRYSLGDIGVPSDRRCLCGRGLPLLERIEGRTDDDLQLADGGRISSHRVRIALRSIPGISQFRFVQEERESFSVHLVSGEHFCPATVEEVERRLTEILGRRIRLNIELVEEIPLDPSGKRRAIISKLQSR